MGRTLVDAIWIRSRMNRTDARHEADARRRVEAAARTQAERAAFHLMLTHPGTAARLDAMLADNLRIDAEQREADRALADVVPCVDLEIVPVPGDSTAPVVVDVQLVPATKDGAQ